MDTFVGFDEEWVFAACVSICNSSSAKSGLDVTD